MAKKSTASKAVIASLLATSAIVPAIAVSADEVVTTSLETTSTAVAQTIDFKVEDASGMLARFVKGPGTLVNVDNQQYIELNLDDSILAMLTAVKVGEQSVLTEVDGKKVVLIPVSDDYAAVEVLFTLESPYANGDYKATLTPDADSIKEVTDEVEETPTTPETPEEAVEEVVTTPYGQIENGEYEVTFDAYHAETEAPNYTPITRQLDTAATLVVEDGEYFLDINATEGSTAIITEYQVLVGKEYVAAETVEGALDKYPHVVRLPLTSLNDLTVAKLHVVSGSHDTWYDFKIAVNKGLDLPEVEEEAVTETLPAFVYEDGKAKLSIMHGKYLANEVTVTATETGYDVDVTFPEGQHLNDFKVEGATVATKSETTEGDNTVKVYTVSVKDLTKIYNSTVDLSVRFGGFSYDEVYGIQLQFGGKQNPFSDILKSDNYGAIVQLYSKGIFKEADKFNPNNNVKRSQFALMLNRALTLETPATSSFTDITKYDVETQNAIKALNNYGVINGTSTTTFAPANDITRKNAALMIYRLLVKEGYTPTDAALTFKDVPTTDKEAAVAIAALNELGIMTGSNGNFNPSKKLTRNQMAKVLNNTLTVIEGLK